MLKALACLFGAMTTTASLLAWMDPSQPLPPEPLTEMELRSLANSLVTESIVLQSDRWEQVEVLAGPHRPSGGVMLAALADWAEPHFFVDDLGRPYRASRWCTQTPSAGRAHTIRIQVAPRRPGAAATLSQWACVQALVGALHAGLAVPDDSLPVQIDPALVGTPTASAATIDADPV